METKLFYSVDEVAELLCCSKSYAYSTIRKWNEELAKEGYFVRPGYISCKYFEKKIYGLQPA